MQCDRCVMGQRYLSLHLEYSLAFIDPKKRLPREEEHMHRMNYKEAFEMLHREGFTESEIARLIALRSTTTVASSQS